MALKVRWLGLTFLVMTCAHAPSLAGTQWRFPPNAVEQLVVTFRPDGTTAFSGLETTGHWKQDGDRLVFDANDFTEYRVVIEGNQMKGQWKRLKGKDEGTTSPTSLERL